MLRRPPAARRRGAGLTLVCVTALAACSSGSSAADPRDGVPQAAAAAPVATASPTGPTQTFPLTGLPAPSAATAATPVVAVAVDAGSGLPGPVGTDKADVVYVGFPSGGRQRGLALYQSADSARVGPVGDTRPVDSKLLVAIDAVLEHSGGAAGYVKQVDAADLPEWSSLVHPETFTRDAASGLVYGSSAAARAATGAVPARTGLLLFADTPAAAAPTPPAPVTVAVSGQPGIRLDFDVASGTWRGAVGSFRLAATNVVVQQVPYDALVVPHTGGRTEGSPNLEGQGKAAILSGPRVDAEGSWNRPGRSTSTKFIGGDGTPIRLSPGITWVLLVPAGSSIGTS